MRNLQKEPCRYPKSRRGGGRTIAALLLSGLACVAQTAGSKRLAAAESCPSGGFDYGSGMVAAVPPQSVQEALVKARAVAQQIAAGRASSFAAEVPYRPHVSLLYGVQSEHAPIAIRAAQAFVNTGRQTAACLMNVRYWDDPAGSKTTLVVDIADRQEGLYELHQSLAQATGVVSRFPYHPHVTLLYLQAGVRLAPEEEQPILDLLHHICWTDNELVVTNRCGQRINRAFKPATGGQGKDAERN